MYGHIPASYGLAHLPSQMEKEIAEEKQLLTKSQRRVKMAALPLP